MEGNDVSRAIELGNLALRDETDRRTIASLRLMVAEAHYWHGDIADAELLANTSMESSDAGSKEWFGALALKITCTGQHGQNDRVVELLDRASRAQARIASSIASPAVRRLSACTMSASEITATSVVPPPMSTIIEAWGSVMGSPTPMPAAMGSSIR